MSLIHVTQIDLPVSGGALVALLLLLLLLYCSIAISAMLLFLA